MIAERHLERQEQGELAVFAAANRRLAGEKDFHATGSLVLAHRECDVARAVDEGRSSQRGLKVEFQPTHERSWRGRGQLLAQQSSCSLHPPLEALLGTPTL